MACSVPSVQVTGPHSTISLLLIVTLAGGRDMISAGVASSTASGVLSVSEAQKRVSIKRRERVLAPASAVPDLSPLVV